MLLSNAKAGEAGSCWRLACCRIRRYRIRRSVWIDRRKRTRTNMADKSRGLQSSMRRSGRRFRRCLCVLRCLFSQGSCQHGTGRCVCVRVTSKERDIPRIESSISESLKNVLERQALTLRTDIKPQQLALFRSRPWLLAPPAARIPTCEGGRGTADDSFHQSRITRRWCVG